MENIYAILTKFYDQISERRDNFKEDIFLHLAIKDLLTDIDLILCHLEEKDDLWKLN